jgi:uncharacterized protein (DUF362 family)
MPDGGERETSRRALVGGLLRVGGLGAGIAGAAAWLASRSHRPRDTAVPVVERHLAVPFDPRWPVMAVVQGGEPAQLVRSAVEELGGMRRFVSRGDVVVIKPNMAWDRTPEQAANTNPDAVAAAARLALDAGARRVVVTDVPINESRRVFERSGIGAAARAAGAQVVLPEDAEFREVDLGGAILREWPVLRPFLDADKVINMPVAKHHSLTGATLGIKNWYGILGGLRHRLHQHIHESLADLASFLRPTLTILDAYRILLRNGPSGGNTEDVALKRTAIAGTDPVALDAYAARAFWGLGPDSLRYLELAAQRGLGSLQLADSHQVHRFLTLR